MKILLPLAATLMLSAAASAQEGRPAPAPAPAPSGPYQICLWPNPCAPRRGTPPKAEAPKPVEAVPADPLTRAIVNGTAERGEDGIVSSIRLSPSHTGTDREQILTRGTGLRDALAPLPATAALPTSKLPANKDGAKGAAEDEWVTVDSKTASAGQLNDMRSERKGAKEGGEAGRASAARMWKHK